MNDLDIIEQAFQPVYEGQIYRHAMNDVEKVLIERALQQCRGNQVIAARILGLNRNTLRAKIKKLNISINEHKIQLQ